MRKTKKMKLFLLPEDTGLILDPSVFIGKTPEECANLCKAMYQMNLKVESSNLSDLKFFLKNGIELDLDEESLNQIVDLIKSSKKISDKTIEKKALSYVKKQEIEDTADGLEKTLSIKAFKAGVDWVLKQKK